MKVLLKKSLLKSTKNRSFRVPENNLIHFYGIDPETGPIQKNLTTYFFRRSRKMIP